MVFARRKMIAVLNFTNYCNFIRKVYELLTFLLARSFELSLVYQNSFAVTCSSTSKNETPKHMANPIVRGKESFYYTKPNLWSENLQDVREIGEIPANDLKKIDGTTVIYSLQNICAFEASYHWTTHSFIGSYI